MSFALKRSLYVLNGFIGFLFLGCCYTWSIFVVPLETLFHYTRVETSLAFTLCIAGFSAGTLLTGILAKRIAYKTIIKLSALMVGWGFFFSGLSHTIIQLYLSYSILSGIGMGLGYASLISVIPLWFPEKIGTVTGILVMGYALSAALFAPLINRLIHTAGVLNTFKIIGIICTCGLLLTSFFVTRPDFKQAQLSPETKQLVPSFSDLSTQRMLRSPVFYLHFLTTIALGGVGLGIINHVSPILTEELKMTASFGAAIVSANALFNGLSRMGWGIVFDRIGVIKSIQALCLTGLSGALLLVMGLLFHSVMLLIIAAFVIVISFGGNASLLPSSCRALFGSTYFTMNYSIYNLNSLIYSFVPAIIGIIQSTTHSYLIPACLMLGCEVLAVILSMVFITR